MLNLPHFAVPFVVRVVVHLQRYLQVAKKGLKCHYNSINLGLRSFAAVRGFAFLER